MRWVAVFAAMASATLEGLELPSIFEANQGQAPGDTLFLLRGSNHSVVPGKREAILTGPAGTVSLHLGGSSAAAAADFAVQFAGAQGEYSGFDQVNVRLASNLIGAGEIDSTLIVDGQTSNPTRLRFE